MNSFQSLRDYEQYLYSLPVRCPDIRGSTLVVIRRSSPGTTPSPIPMTPRWDPRILTIGTFTQTSSTTACRPRE